MAFKRSATADLATWQSTRAYVVGRDGHYLRSHAFVAADEELAIEHAKKFIDVHNVELWSGTRFIARLDQKAK